MKKAICFSVILIGFQIIAALILLPHLPERIPAHWNIHGQVDGYGSPWTIFIAPAVSIGLVLLLVFLPRIDPLGENAPRWR